MSDISLDLLNNKKDGALLLGGYITYLTQLYFILFPNPMRQYPKLL